MLWVRNKLPEVIEYFKESKPKRPVSNVSSSGLSRRKTFSSKGPKNSKNRRMGSESHAHEGLIKTMQSNKHKMPNKRTVSRYNIRKQKSDVSSNSRKDIKSLTIDLYSEKCRQKGVIKAGVKKETDLYHPVKTTSNLRNYHNSSMFSTKNVVERIANKSISKIPHSLSKSKISEEAEVRCEVENSSSEKDNDFVDDVELSFFAEHPNKEIPVPHKMNSVFEKRFSNELLLTRPSRNSSNMITFSDEKMVRSNFVGFATENNIQRQDQNLIDYNGDQKA